MPFKWWFTAGPIVALCTLAGNFFILYNRSGNYKLIQGFPGAFQDWYKPDQYFKRDGFEGDYANNIFDRSVKQQIFNSSMQLGIWGDGLYNLKGKSYSSESSFF